MRSGTFGRGSVALAVALTLASSQLLPTRAQAQCDPALMPATCSRVSPDAKGIIGLGLIGAELGFIIPALVQEAAGGNDWWPYLVFPILGAVGGAIGGWGVEQATRTQPEIDVALLAIGMALIVPTMVGTLALTAYDPGESTVQVDGDQAGEEPTYEDETTTEAVQVEDTGDAPPEGTPPPSDAAPSDDAAEPADDGGGASLRRSMDRILAGGPGLLRFDGFRSQLLLGVPMVRGIATFTSEESRTLQLAPSSDVNIPIVSATF